MAIRSVGSGRRSISLSALNRRGSILMIALWSLCLLSVFAVVLGYGVRQRMALSRRLDERSRLRLIAEAGVKKAIAELKSEEMKSYDCLSDPWSNNIAAFKDVKLGDGKFIVAYNSIDWKRLAPEIRYGATDEEGKININTTNRQVLERLFMIVLNLGDAEAQELAASIIDWRDTDNELSVPTGSAEDSYYKSLSYPYAAKNGSLDILDELLLVKGVSKSVFDRLIDYLTIYGDGKVNINTASKPVLLALGLGEDIVDKIIDFRYGKDGILGTADDGIFDAQANIVPKLSQAYNLNDSDLVKLTPIVEQGLTTYSNNFMVRSVAILSNGRNAMEAVSVVGRNGKVLYWKES